MALSEETKQKFTTIAENQQKVYGNGVVDGKKSQYDEFWDFFQKNGKRTNYRYAFYGEGWGSDNFKPKYQITPVGDASMMFWLFSRTNGKTRVDLSKFNIDFSKVTNFTRVFSDSYISDCGFVDCSNATSLNMMCDGGYYSSSIQKILLKVSANQNLSNSFGYTYSLESLMFTTDSEIGCSLTLKHAPLTVESMKSVITHLKDYKGTESEYTYKVTFSSACLTALEAEGATSPNGNTWTEYMEDLGWLYS